MGMNVNVALIHPIPHIEEGSPCCEALKAVLFSRITLCLVIAAIAFALLPFIGQAGVIGAIVSICTFCAASWITRSSLKTMMKTTCSSKMSYGLIWRRAGSIKIGF
jgi:ABC-type protease/lipase transport system fused ATPase/permease subunit